MIAVVDDDVCFAEETQELLYASGFQAVIVITHPHESSMALLEHMRLLVLDLDLNGTSGLSILQTLEHRGCRPAVLMVSGSGRIALDRAQEAAANSGFRVLGALQKPVSPTEFIEVVRLLDLTPEPPSADNPKSQPHAHSVLLGKTPEEHLTDTYLGSRL